MAPSESLKGKGKGLVFVLSSPSGGGKTTLIKRVVAELRGLQFSVSYTTRPPRANEEEGRDYHFVTTDRFRQMAAQGEFLEWAQVLGNYYGTTQPDLERLEAEGMDLILDIDIQGAQQVVQKCDRAITIFVLPPSPKALKERLIQRGLDSSEIVERRLDHAKQEIKEVSKYHYLILNDRIEEAVESLKAIILAERCRRDRRSIFERIMKSWEVDYGKNHC